MYRLTLMAFFTFIVFVERMTLYVGDIRVRVLEMVFVAIAIITWAGWRQQRVRMKGGWIATVGPLFTLLTALPVLAVTLGGYGVTALYSVMLVLVPLSILSFATWPCRTRPALLTTVFLAIIAHGLYGLAQTLARLNALPQTMSSWIREQDLLAQSTANELYVITGRSTGLFLNANTFGVWSSLALVFAYAHLRGWRQAIALTLGIVGVIGSQSRTGAIAATILIIIWVIQVLKGSRNAGVLSMNLGLFVGAPLAVAVLGGWWRPVIEADFARRLISGLGVVTEGVSGDRNLSLRVNSWEQALAFVGPDWRFSVGTLGPPQVYYPSFIDNQFVALYVQGWVPLVVAYLLALASPWTLSRRQIAGTSALKCMSIVVTVASLTLLPLYDTALLSILWVAVSLRLPVDESRTVKHDSALSAGQATRTIN